MRETRWTEEARRLLNSAAAFIELDAASYRRMSKGAVQAESERLERTAVANEGMANAIRAFLK